MTLTHDQQHPGNACGDDERLLRADRCLLLAVLQPGWAAGLLLPQIAHQQLHGLLATDGDEAGDLLVTADTEGTHSEPGLTEHWLLASQLLQHLCTTAPGHNSSNRRRSVAAPSLPACWPACPASHLCSLLQAITRLSNADVEHQLGHADFPHGVSCLGIVLQAGKAP